MMRSCQRLIICFIFLFGRWHLFGIRMLLQKKGNNVLILWLQPVRFHNKRRKLMKSQGQAVAFKILSSSTSSGLGISLLFTKFSSLKIWCQGLMIESLDKGLALQRRDLQPPSHPKRRDFIADTLSFCDKWLPTSDLSFCFILKLATLEEDLESHSENIINFFWQSRCGNEACAT